MIGSIQSFNPKTDNWKLYQEQMEQFFTINSIADTTATNTTPAIKKRVSALLSLIGQDTYKTLRDLCTPVLPKDKTYEELCGMLGKQFSPTTCVFRERIDFYEAKQQDGESVNEWYARIHNLAVNCEFGADLNPILKDKFVCGMRKGNIRDRLCEESQTTTLERLLEVAQSRESTLQNQASDTINAIKKPQHKSDASNRKSHQVTREPPSTRQTRDGTRNGRWNCKRCAGTHTGQQVCKYINYTCNICKKIGHIARACLSKNKQNYVDMPTINNISFNNDNPVYVEVMVNQAKLSFLLDSGACVSVITEKDYKQHCSRIQLDSKVRDLKNYSGHPIKLLGSFKSTLQYNDMKVSNFVLHVVENRHGKQSVLGRDFLQQFNFRLVSDYDSGNQILVIDTNIEKIIDDFKDVFSNDLGCYKHNIFNLKLKDNFTPVFLKPRTIPLAHKEKVEKELERLESEGVIEPIDSSDWGTPLVPVVKKDGNIRLCADYRVTVNKHLDKVTYPLPLADEIFSKLNGGESFSKIDLSNAYNQLCVDEEASKILTWSTHKGLYKVKRIPFGITPASAIFQRTLEQVLQGSDGTANLLDDIIVTGTTRAQHEHNLKEVFAKLREAGLKINLSKCSFFQNEIQFLGHTITKDGLKKNNDKITAIVDAPTPKTTTQIKSFAGMVNYYSKFVPRLSILMRPMYNLLKKNTRFEWTTECDQVFNEIKKIISSEEILTHFNPQLPLILTTDASNDGIAAVLSHEMGDKQKKPIIFISRTLNQAERNYAVVDKEALSIYWAVKKLAYYLTGNNFTIETDHKPLTALFDLNKRISASASGRMQRWVLFLSGFSYTVKYIKGQENNVADMLSRHPLEDTHVTDNEDDVNEQYLDLIVSEGIPINSKRISLETRRDPVLSKVLNFVKNGWPEKNDENLIQFQRKQNELSCEQDCLLWGYRVVVPTRLRKQLLDELHASHLGIAKMKSVARSYFWWPRLDEEIEQLAKSCKACIMTSDDPQKSIPTPWNKATKPWQRVHVDYLGPLNNKYYFIMLDAFSKWPEIFEMKNMTSQSTIQKFRETFCRWGIPELIVSDNGTQLVSKECETFLQNNGIHHITTAPYHPSSNGAAENAVKSFKKALKAALLDQRNKNVPTDVLVSRYLLNYRNAKHCTTNETPALLMLNRDIRTLFNLLRPGPQNFKNLDKGRQITLEEGEVVAIRDYSDVNNKAWMEATIIRAIGQKMYECQIQHNKKFTRRHIDQIKKIALTQIGQNQVTPTESKTKGPAIIVGQSVSLRPNPHQIQHPVTIAEHSNPTSATSTPESSKSQVRPRRTCQIPLRYRN